MKELFKITVDDSNFVSLINRLITSTANKNLYEVVKIIKIKNWFDHKWLNYSGSEVILFESGGLVNDDLALSQRWKDQITFPPFNPGRVLSAKTYPLNRDILKEDLKPTHRYQTSGQNLQNRVNLKSENVLYAWFSSNSALNKKGSLMVYELVNKEVRTWYCQIELNDTWNIGKTKNISAEFLRNAIK